MSVYREPPAETEDYPGLVVCDQRVTGSITTGYSRLPLWCFAWTAVVEGWPAVESGWSPSRHNYTADDFGLLLTDLFEQRGEFGRLLCVLADVERRERVRNQMLGPAWWETRSQRKRVLAQLRRCVAALESEEGR